jgi:Tol biopolymer transport system component
VKLGPHITTGDEQSPSVSPDGQKLYFVASARQGFLWDIWVSTWDSSVNDWGTPVNVGYPVNTPDVEFSAHIAPDGLRLFFDSDGGSRCGIYMSEWNGTSWSAPQLQWDCSIPPGVFPDYPSVPTDGQWLYFNDWVSDGKSIFAAKWDSDSGWVLPAYDLRPQIGGRSSTPSVTSSGDSLFFASGDIGGFGARDIWLMKRLLQGDLNLDSQLTAADVVLGLNKIFLDLPYPAPEPLGDMNCDGDFTPADAVILLQVVYLGLSSQC